LQQHYIFAAAFILKQFLKQLQQVTLLCSKFYLFVKKYFNLQQLLNLQQY